MNRRLLQRYPLLLFTLAMTGSACFAQGTSEDQARLQKWLGVPAAVATVRDGWLPAGRKTPEFVLIQDIHRHPEAQQNIAAIILHGAAHWGARDVFIEGSWADGEGLKPLSEPLPSLREAVQSGRLSGAELAMAMATDHDFHLLGLEEAAIYRKNVEFYDRVMSAQKVALRELNTNRMLGNLFDLSLSEQWDRVERLIRLRLKPSEYADYLRAPFRGTPGTQLAEAVARAERFYEIADARSRIFLQRSEARNCAGPRVLVVGGFHTAAMAELLKQEHRSFVVLAPHITQSGYDELYAQGMHDTISALKLH